MGSKTFLENVPPENQGDRETVVIKPEEVGSISEVLEKVETEASKPKQGKAE